MRLPRVLLAALIGADFPCPAACFRACSQIHLATPDTLGVASGASFGAALALLLGFGFLGVQLTAFCFGLAAVGLTCLMGRGGSRASMILSGIMMGSLFSALVSLVKFTADTESQLPAITYWLMGSLSAASFASLRLGAPALIIGVPVGFVNVVESKELILEGNRAPYIIARGRKGGSNVAAAICNAMLYQIKR